MTEMKPAVCYLQRGTVCEDGEVGEAIVAEIQLLEMRQLSQLLRDAVDLVMGAVQHPQTCSQDQPVSPKKYLSYQGLDINFLNRLSVGQV
jgi:hypothetical protein